ncbi:MAG: SpoIID/LytB domain-containing protein [Phycisphaerae bacterium]|nr:SpoIID/LytB domain-containing protein [Phycisphaerae bacterium]NUQ46670.1 SpoIID/LytB domain-containing protein [Phycisphaerae bacterium]
MNWRYRLMRATSPRWPEGRSRRRGRTLVAVALITAVAAIAIFDVGCRMTRTTGPEAGPGVVPDVPTTPLTAAPPDRTVRVRLCGKYGCESFTLALKSAYQIRDVDSGALLVDAHRGFSTLAVSPDPRSERFIRIGAYPYASGHIEVVPAREPALVINGNLYPGSLVIRRDGRRVLVTNHVDVEAYLPGVLAGELPASFHGEAFAAQAVAARTYVLYHKQVYGAKRDYDVLPDERSQMYVGVPGPQFKIATLAVGRTLGEVCTLPDAPEPALFSTYYASCCGGMSQGVNAAKPGDPQVGPLRGGVACDACRDAPYFRWKDVRLSKAELTKRLVERYPSLARLGAMVRFEPTATSADGRISRIRLSGKNGESETLVGEDFRLAVGGRQIKSTRCNLLDDGDGVVFYEGRGFGHGLGLCQYGANGLARRGLSYREILAHYYPGCVIRTLQ